MSMLGFIVPGLSAWTYAKLKFGNGPAKRIQIGAVQSFWLLISGYSDEPDVYLKSSRYFILAMCSMFNN